MARGLTFTLCDDDCGGCMSSSADSGGGSWESKLLMRDHKSPSSCSSPSSPSSPPYIRTLRFGSGSRSRGGGGSSVGDVFYGTDDAVGIEEYKYKEDVLEVYRREKERKSARRKNREMRQRSWFRSFVDCFSFLKLFYCFR